MSAAKQPSGEDSLKPIQVTRRSGPHRKTTPKERKQASKGATKGKRPQSPKRKSFPLRREAHQRAGERLRAKAIADPMERRLAEAILVRTHFLPRLLRLEPSVQQSRWPAYCQLTELEATELFASLYTGAYRSAAKELGDPEWASRRPIEEDLLRNALPDLASLVKARQLADSLGLPYGPFLQAIVVDRVRGEKWRQPPLPNQLLAGNVVAARFRGRPTAQDRSAWAGPVIPSAVRIEAASVATVGDPVALPDHAPGCFGHRRVARDTPCKNCPWSAPCKRFRTKVTYRLIEAHGSSNPRADRTRRMATDRKRKQRIRQRNEAS